MVPDQQAGDLMILLSEIDHRRVLDGARVPLCWHITDEDIAAADHPTDRRLLEDARNVRIEWCGDIGWRHEGAGYPPQFFREPWGAMAIDPAHPDVARVLDRKIAEAVYGATFECAWLTFDQMQSAPWWLIRVSSCGYSMQGASLSIEPTWDAIKDIAPTTANIPAARAALIRALYPAVKV